MLKQFNHRLVQALWKSYCLSSPDMQKIMTAFTKKNITNISLDHFAIIDLPSIKSGIPTLKKIFTLLNFAVQGKGYLAEKQNDFLWMSEANCQDQLAANVLPQVVIADFRLDELPPSIKSIIEKYTKQIQPLALQTLQSLVEKMHKGDQQAAESCFNILCHYFTKRDWPIPTCKEFYTVKECNELLAWVLIYGRKPNHFTLALHLMTAFTSLSDFHGFIEKEANLTLNRKEGSIKGGETKGIAQSSTMGINQTIKLMDGEISLPTGFVEFVWRYPKNKLANTSTPLVWNAYFTGFIDKHADKVIESLYQE